jgi:DNA-binding transcriptional MerR regulator
MLIGELSRRTGVSAKAIRLYETMNLLGPVQRRGRYRVFHDDHVGRIEVVLHSKALGLRLTEIADVMTAPSKAAASHHALRLVEARIAAERATLAMARASIERLSAARDQIAACLRA